MTRPGDEPAAPAGYRVLGNLANGPDVLGCLACGAVIWNPDTHTGICVALMRTTPAGAFRVHLDPDGHVIGVTPAPPPKLGVEDVPAGELL